MQADGPTAAFALLPLLCMLVFFVLGAVATGFWIWMLVDCLTKESSQGNDKLVWAVVIFFLHGLGAILYYFVRRPQRIRDLGQ
jgi:DMSO reductase anchor subunit